VHDADPTRKALFNPSGLGAGTTRTYSLPNTSSELAILAGTQTFTGRRPSPARSPPQAAKIDTATGTATYGVGIGATAGGSTKTLNPGTGGAAGSTAVINIGSAPPARAA